MKFLVLSSRNSKEILRDPINLFFGVGFPIILLLLLSAIQLNVPTNLFHINNLSPGIVIFGLSFFSLFSGTLIAKDRASSFMMRLFASPLTSTDFIIFLQRRLHLIEGGDEFASFNVVIRV
jgi:ABC-2 type transport system permease protein